MTENTEKSLTPSKEDRVKSAKPFEFLLNAVFEIEKLRVAAQVRKTHLAKNGRQDPETDALFEKIKELEKYADDRVAALIKSHPAYSWFSKVKGIGRENIGKVVGLVDIEKADTISSLWKFAGYAVDENGKAPKRKKNGGKLSYNSRLRSMCWRLGGSLMKGKGKFFEYYCEEKDKYVERLGSKGIKIVPATKLPKKEGKRYEPDDMISEGHLHNMALRKMIKLFLACLWLIWRENCKLPTRKPYVLEYKNHTTFIGPWEMTDRK